MTAERVNDATIPSGSPSSGLLLTLDRGIQVLEQIARGQGRSTAKSLTADLQINLGTCYQLLRTLQSHGYVHRLPGGHYGLGPRVGFLVDHYGSSVAPPPELTEMLHEVHRALQETVYLTVRRGRDLPVVGVLEGTKALRVGNVSVGYAGHPHARATAKAFLAFADSRTRDEFFDSKEFEQLTPNTTTTWEGVLDELEATRRRGYGLEREELAEGVVSIASAILDEDGRPYGAFGASFPVALDVESVVGDVVAAGERASRFMGYRDAYPPAP
jgi:DNA-binding IclR family transcriptional regulator